MLRVPSENSQNLPKINVATKDLTTRERTKVGGSLFGITGERRMTEDDKMKDKPKVKSDAEKKKIVLPVIRPTDPRRWAIALTDYSHTPQTKQLVSTRSMAPVKRDPQVEGRPKDHRRWGIAPRGRGMAPPHEQYSQDLNVKMSDAEFTEPRQIPEDRMFNYPPLLLQQSLIRAHCCLRQRRQSQSCQSLCSLPERPHRVSCTMTIEHLPCPRIFGR